MDVTLTTSNSFDLPTHLRLARAFRPEEAGHLLREVLGSRAWRDSGEVREVWFEEAFQLFHRDHEPLRAMAEELLGRVSELSVESMRERLTGIFVLWEETAPELVARGFDWIRDRGEAGDADAVATLMCGWVEPGPSTADELLPLVGITVWLLKHGGSALRSARHAVLLPLLVDVVRHHAAEHVELALRYVARNEHGGHAWAPGWIDVMWQAVETALRRGAGVGLLPDLLSIPRVSVALSASQFFAPFESPELPCARAEMVRAIAGGQLPRSCMQEAWRRVIAGTDPRTAPALFETLSLESLLGCSEVLVEITRLARPVPETWVVFVGTELLRRTALERSHGLLEHAPQRLENLATWPALQPGLRRALERALRDVVDPGISRANEILAAHAAPAAVYAAVHALPRRGPSAPALRVDVEGALGELGMLLRACRRRQVRLGLPREVLRVTEVKVGDLEDGYAVSVSGATLRVSESGVRAILCGPGASTARMRLAAYVIHELIHVSQGIDDKRSVLDLKKAGETTLLHLDLSADHATALILASVVPGSDLAAIKDLQGRSLADFPAGPAHAPSAVERKSIRLVSLRADHLVRLYRACGLGDEHGYVYADYPPGAGTLAVLASGSMQRVLDAGSLDAAAAGMLANAARPPTDIDGIDRLLLSALPGLGRAAKSSQDDR